MGFFESLVNALFFIKPVEFTKEQKRERFLEAARKEGKTKDEIEVLIYAGYAHDLEFDDFAALKDSIATTGIDPPNELLQQKYVDYALKKDWNGLKKLYEITHVEPKFMHDIYSNYIKSQQWSRIDNVQRVTGVPPPPYSKSSSDYDYSDLSSSESASEPCHNNDTEDGENGEESENESGPSPGFSGYPSGVHFSGGGNRTGYTDDKGRVFDRNGNPAGHIENDRYYDKSGSYAGKIEDGVLYDKNGNRAGYVDENGIHYDKNGNRSGWTD